MLTAVGDIIVVCAPNPARLIHLEVLPLSSPAVSDFPWKVNIPGREHVVNDQTVESAFTDHESIFVVCTDMIKGLPP